MEASNCRSCCLYQPARPEQSRGGRFSSLDDARARLAKFREHYNQQRPTQCTG
ncbi:MAG: integrase core domain-containing protein [Candidatus Sulfotelmatobacter sp.]